MNLEPGKKIYFLSDFHLGVPDYESSLVRERKVVAFLDLARKDAAQIMILGDMFDFWYEYKYVVPKGYTRLLGKLAEITDSGIPVIFFVGNHDMWMRNYFEQELNIPVYFEPKMYEWNQKRFFIGHGDGLGPGDHKYKMLKKVFRSRLCQWFFGVLHPSWGIGLANYFSKKSRIKTMVTDKKFLGEDREWLIIFSRQMLAKEHFDYFIFGHRHFPLDFTLNKTSRYINLGDWVRDFTYAYFDGSELFLKKWED
ncbi:MAG TPA: UDP-2,3-diacylglucosamine diphosphatase [Panacibacter sp.]|nr:UDP-2,3-diacylglucosamine diphosphatase [Panacibacter sp.]HNP42781.1 UDP-2,3-diacylglucosamine diphosphatase [Panacibacter sp.]